MKIIDGLLYSKSHEWVKIEDKTATIGITDFAQSELGTVVFVDLPEVGDETEQDEEFGEIESHKAVSELKAPLSGEVTAINEDLEDVDEEEHPVNTDPYQAGWLIKITISDLSEADALMTAAQYQEFIG